MADAIDREDDEVHLSHQAGQGRRPLLGVEVQQFGAEALGRAAEQRRLAGAATDIEHGAVAAWVGGKRRWFLHKTLHRRHFGHQCRDLGLEAEPRRTFLLHGRPGCRLPCLASLAMRRLALQVAAQIAGQSQQFAGGIRPCLGLPFRLAGEKVLQRANAGVAFAEVGLQAGLLPRHRLPQRRDLPVLDGEAADVGAVCRTHQVRQHMQIAEELRNQRLVARRWVSAAQ